MLDRGKVERVQRLSRSASVSDAVDAALDRYLADAELRSDIAAYVREPLAADELALTAIPLQLDLGDDDVDYDALYAAPK